RAPPYVVHARTPSDARSPPRSASAAEKALALLLAKVRRSATGHHRGVCSRADEDVRDAEVPDLRFAFVTERLPRGPHLSRAAEVEAALVVQRAYDDGAGGSRKRPSRC